jgi:hypothetical protein
MELPGQDPVRPVSAVTPCCEAHALAEVSVL